MNTGHIHRQEDHATGSDGLHLFVNCLSFALHPAPAQAIECAKDRLVSVGLQNQADMVRVRDNGGSIIWEGR